MGKIEAYFRHPVNVPRKILLVDDEEDILWIMKKIVKEAGHKLITATTAREGIEKFRKSKDLYMAMVDLRLGNENGLAFIRKAKKINNRVKFVMITAFGDANVRAKARQLGARHFLDKPLKVEKILDIINGE